MAPRSSPSLRERIRYTIKDCSLGLMLVAATERGVCAIVLGDRPEALMRELQRRFPRAELIGGDASFEKTFTSVLDLVDSPTKRITLPLDLRGTAFQGRVWKALQKVPAGKTASYRDIARAIGKPAAVRAVAQACGANPVAIVVPCHRIVRTDGSLGGYRWGLERKKELLRRERT